MEPPSSSTPDLTNIIITISYDIIQVLNDHLKEYTQN